MDSVSASTEALAVLYPDPNAGGMITVNGPSESHGGFFPTNADAFFTTMTMQYPLANGSSKSTWFDAQFLQSASSQFFGSVAAQFASQYLRTPADDTVSGTATMVQPRLVILPNVFYPIEVLLGLLTITTVVLAWVATTSLTPLHPTSIGGTTAILGGDSELTLRMNGTGSHDLPQLKRHLLGLALSNSKCDLLDSDLSHGDSSTTPATAMLSKRDKEIWWRPFILRPGLREIILLIPVLVIVVPEIMLHYSQRNDGLTTIDPERHKLYASRLIPAVLFSLIEMGLASLAFNVSLMTPFATARKGPSSSHVSLFDKPLVRFPIQNLWFSARSKQVALFCSVFLTIVTFFMVTVSSGLFVTGDYSEASTVTQLSWFQAVGVPYNNDSVIDQVSVRNNLSKPLHYAQDNGAVKAHPISNSILELNQTYPPWTYGELAFPQLVVSKNTTADVSNATSVTANLPALRANLECDVLEKDQLNITYAEAWDAYTYGQNFSYQLTTVGYPFPQACSARQSTYQVQLKLPSRLSSAKAGIVPPCPVSYFRSVAESECPYALGIYGYATDTKFVNYSAILCRAFYEQVQTTAMLDLPQYVFSKTIPPAVNESQTKQVNSTDIRVFLDSNLYMGFYNTSETTWNGYATIDSVTSALIYGKDGIPAKQIFQHDPTQFLVPALKQLIQTTGAQHISYFYRSANSSLPSVDATIPATLQMGPIYRLKQNATSTRILDGLLAASTLLGAIVIFTFRYRDVAKAQPGRLAATLALVADSEFVRDL